MNLFFAFRAQTAIMGDTVVTIVARDTLSTVVDLAVVVLVVALVVAVMAVVGLILALRRGVLKVKDLVARLEKDPILRRGQNVAENVEAISASLRKDVTRLSASVEQISERLDQASERMEERVEDFNALLEVMQEEAEDIFVRTASRVRGVRAAAGSLTGAEEGHGRRRGTGAAPTRPTDVRRTPSLEGGGLEPERDEKGLPDPAIPELNPSSGPGSP
jgi:methyl-accepting chemotaxis protein